VSPTEEDPLMPVAAAGESAARLKIVPYFQAVTRSGGSDLHLKPGAAPHIRVGTIVRRVKQDALSEAQIIEMVNELLDDSQREFLRRHGSIDIAVQVPGADRFRLNIYRQRNHVSIAGRRVTAEIPDFAALHLPPIVEQVSAEHQGLILVAGPTSSGKSTTIAAMLEHINQTRNCHVITIEDPIEYLYVDKKAFITQREIGIDVGSFQEALKYLPREDPDVVLIGEMRDHNTFQAALQVAETGHLVMGTIHAASAAQTIGRILDLFPHESRDLIRKSLGFNLKAVLCQRLLPSINKDIDRIPAVEVMLMNPSVRQLIEEKRDEDLTDLIRASERSGMLSFTTSLLSLIERDLVDPRVAYEIAPNPDELKMAMKGISSEGGGLIGR
jgi:twitching motility protein PilT